MKENSWVGSAEEEKERGEKKKYFRVFDTILLFLLSERVSEWKRTDINDESGAAVWSNRVSHSALRTK
jgi:predicted transcriptional regulator